MKVGCGSGAFFVVWARGIEPAGQDAEGARWKFVEESDFRMRILKNLIEGN
jgi:hypothetical protein